MFIFPHFTMMELTLSDVNIQKIKSFSVTYTADSGLNFHSNAQSQCKLRASKGDIISSQLKHVHKEVSLISTCFSAGSCLSPLIPFLLKTDIRILCGHWVSSYSNEKFLSGLILLLNIHGHILARKPEPGSLFP